MLDPYESRRRLTITVMLLASMVGLTCDPAVSTPTPTRRQFLDPARRAAARAPTSAARHDWAVAISVGYRTEEGPNWDSCGGFVWKVQFFITDQAGTGLAPLHHSASWVLQHFVRTETWALCDGSLASQDPDEYWEAWRVGEDGWTLEDYSYVFDSGVGALPAQGGKQDVFRWPNVPGSYGKWAIDSHVYWLETVPDAYLSITMPRRGVGDLAWAAGPPPNLALNSWTLERHVTSAWNCCKDERDGRAPNTWTGEATAKNGAGTYEEEWKTGGHHRKRVLGQDVP